MRRFLILLLLLLTLPTIAWAQRIDQLPGRMPGVPASSLTPNAPLAPPVPPPHDRIAAVVNDNVISTTDIEARMKLALLSSGLPATPEVEQRLLPQILRGLIDEQLETQEAKRLDITVSKEDIDKAMEHIAQDNNISGDMRDFVKDHGGSPEAMEQQIRAGLSWNKVIQRELRPRVEVGDDEVDAVIERVRANAGKEEFLVNEIFLSVDSPKDEDQVKQVADNLVQQIKGGANFTAVARQFSQGTGAASGGDIGWIQEGQLPPELNHVLVTLQKGDISSPIRSSSGFHILGLREKRTISLGGDGDENITVDLQQVFRPFDSNTTRDALLQEADQLKSAVKSCNNLQNQIEQQFPNWRWQSLGTVKRDKVPGWLADKVRDIPVGKGSDPLATDKGALIVFVCDRHVPEGNVDREAIVNSIGTEKLELQARRLQRDLRRAAYLDIRLSSGS